MCIHCVCHRCCFRAALTLEWSTQPLILAILESAQTDFNSVFYLISVPNYSFGACLFSNKRQKGVDPDGRGGKSGRTKKCGQRVYCGTHCGHTTVSTIMFSVGREVARTEGMDEVTGR